MSFALRRALRYARGWVRDPTHLVESEHDLLLEDGTIPATVLQPANAETAPFPGWVVLHGITRPGRAHPTLRRFTRALASTGGVVIVPEVPEWIRLRLLPGRTEPTVRAALRHLEEDPGVAPDRIGLVGFSFGAPQAIRMASDEAVARRVSGVVAFGGYCDLPRTVRFQMTGWHEWEGAIRQVRPDPYGRWIIAGNFLTGVPGWEGAAPVADALLELASAAGEAQVPAWDPIHDPVKSRLRDRLGREERELFDLFAPPADLDPPTEGPESLAWSERLAEAAARREPLLDAVAQVGELGPPVHILHGRSDALVPSTEAFRLGERLAPHGRVRVTVTGLFGHSGGAGGSAGMGRIAESGRFVVALARLLGSV